MDWRKAIAASLLAGAGAGLEQYGKQKHKQYEQSDEDAKRKAALEADFIRKQKEYSDKLDKDYQQELKYKNEMIGPYYNQPKTQTKKKGQISFDEQIRREEELKKRKLGKYYKHSGSTEELLNLLDK